MYANRSVKCTAAHTDTHTLLPCPRSEQQAWQPYLQLQPLCWRSHSLGRLSPQPRSQISGAAGVTEIGPSGIGRGWRATLAGAAIP